MENQKEYTTELWVSSVDPESIFKLDIKFTEQKDGSGNIQIEWDETDADLQWWTNLGEEKQQQFILDALDSVIKQTIPEETSNNEP
jgi:hypothetical protein